LKLEIIGPFDFQEYDAHQIDCIISKYHPSNDRSIKLLNLLKSATETSTETATEQIEKRQQSRRQLLFDEQMHIWTNVERPHIILGIEKLFETRIRQPFHFMHIERQHSYSTRDHSSVIGVVNGLADFEKTSYVYPKVQRVTWGIFLADKPELEELKQEIILEWKFNQ